MRTAFPYIILASTVLLQTAIAAAQTAGPHPGAPGRPASGPSAQAERAGSSAGKAQAASGGAAAAPLPYIPPGAADNPYYRRLKEITEQIQLLQLQLQKAGIEAEISTADNTTAINEQKTAAAKRDTMSSKPRPDTAETAKVKTIKDRIEYLELQRQEAKIEAEIADAKSRTQRADASAKLSSAGDPDLDKLRRELTRAQLKAGIAQADSQRAKSEKGDTSTGGGTGGGSPAGLAPDRPARPMAIDAILGRGDAVLAILSMPDGTRVRAVVGTALPNGAKVTAIDGNGVTIARDGRTSRLGFAGESESGAQTSGRTSPGPPFAAAPFVPIRPPASPPPIGGTPAAAAGPATPGYGLPPAAGAPAPLAPMRNTGR